MSRTTDINPDADIRVAAVYDDGSLRIYSSCNKQGVRAHLHTLHFPHKGAALEHASEFDAKERKKRAERGVSKIYD